jgi:hypothetical protein
MATAVSYPPKNRVTVLPMKLLIDFVVKRANDTTYGFAAGVRTRDINGVLTIILLVCGLVFAQAVGYAQEQKANPAPVQTGGSEPVQEKSSEDGAHQSIKIHGHWTIEVHNPDGTLATHREFENAYVPGVVLPSVLSGQLAITGWEVALDGSPEPCNTSSGTPKTCLIVQSSIPDPSSDSTNLVVAQNSGTLVISGSVTAASSTSISTVNTVVGFVGVAGKLTLNPFSQANLVPGSSTPPIGVLRGQTAQVTVVISFS